MLTAAQLDELIALAMDAVQRCGIYAYRDGSCVCGAKPYPVSAGVKQVDHDLTTCPIQRNVRLEAWARQMRRAM